MEIIKYCIQCGSNVELKIPINEERERAVCVNCSYIHYQNPRIVVCTITVDNQKILLAKRNIEPRKNFWTLPGGFLEMNESPEAGAKRETEEETYCQIDIIRPFSMIMAMTGEQVHIFYLAKLRIFSDQPTAESSQVKMFNYNEIPWSELSFLTVKATLEQYLSNPNHLGVICGKFNNQKQFIRSI